MMTETSFGQWLKQRRKALDLTQDELAERVGCAVETIRKIEAGQRRPSRDIAEHLAQELVTDPEERVTVVRLARALGPVNVSIPETHASRAHNLPRPATRFIGRECDVALVVDLLGRPHVRLVTLTGPGGVGKTRLALQVAADIERDFTDGVVFVDLAPVRDPVLVPSTLAHALHLSDSDEHTLLVRLQEILRDRHLLLLLDNFEQVLPAAPLLATLLAAAPQLKVLLTSRVVAGIYGEHDFAVPPLVLPAPNDLHRLDRLGQVETVRLFVERAQAVKSDFCLTRENAQAVSAICHQLDGLPLSIELAAARVRLVPPQLLLQRFSQAVSGRLQLLTGGARTLPARQQTVRATIAWSYDLLDARDQRLFRRLAVFVGGCTLKAAATVCGWEDAAHVLTALESLLDNSLLHARERVPGEVRVTMLETIREYALEQLATSGELAQLQRRHADYCVTLAERVEPAWHRLPVGRWDRLEAEHDNMRAALVWSRTEASGETGLRLTVALGGFWHRRGHLTEGSSWLAAVTQREVGVASGPSSDVYRRLRAYALQWRATFAVWQGDLDAPEPWYAESMALFRDLGDQVGLAETLCEFGMLFVWRGDFGVAEALLDESLNLFRLSCVWGIGYSYYFLGLLAYAQGNFGRAADLWEEGRRCVPPGVEPWVRASNLLHRGMVALDLGDDGRAGACVAESLSWFQEQGERWQTLLALEVVARLALGQGGPSLAAQEGVLRAARLCGAAEALRATLAAPRPPIFEDTYRRSVATLRAQLDAHVFEVAWSEGRAMTLEQAIAYAVETMGAT